MRAAPRKGLFRAMSGVCCMQSLACISARVVVCVSQAITVGWLGLCPVLHSAAGVMACVCAGCRVWCLHCASVVECSKSCDGEGE